MKIDIYKSTSNDNKYLSVPEATDITQLNLPDDLDPDLLNLSLFKPSLELDPGKPMVGINQEDVNKQISEKGYAIHGATMDVAINLTGNISFF